MSSDKNQRLLDKELKCNMQVKLNHMLKMMLSKRNFEGKLMQILCLLLCTCLSMHNKHSTVSQAVVSYFTMYMSNAYSSYVFNAVSLRQFAHASCLRTRLWLIHDAEVIFDRHLEDIRTIWPLEHGFLLLH